MFWRGPNRHLMPNAERLGAPPPGQPACEAKAEAGRGVVVGVQLTAPAASAASAAATVRFTTSAGWEMIASGRRVLRSWLHPSFSRTSAASGGMADHLGRPCTRRAAISRPGPHHVAEGARGQGLLDGVQHLCLDRVDVTGEVVDEVVLREPHEALLSTNWCASAGVGGPCARSPPSDSPSSIAEGRDVDQTDDVWRFRPERGYDLAAVGMAGDDGRTVLEGQYMAQPARHHLRARSGEIGVP